MNRSSHGGENVIPALPDNPTITLLTMSFRGDLDLCRLLCETVDRQVPAEFPHILAVPKADLPLFRSLANARRLLITQEELLPPWLFRIPLPSPRLRRLLRLPRRNVYVSLGGSFVRGWIAQQMMKLAAACRVGGDVILHVDSDVAFVRPLTRDHLIRDGRARLLHVPGEGDTPMHAPWHRAASDLLGLGSAGYHGADSIGNLVTWRRPLVEAMLGRIRDIRGEDAFRALARMPEFSEYILYDVFCDKVVGLDGSGHFPTPRLLCATLWPNMAREELDEAVRSMRIDDDQVAIGVQSTVPMTMAARRRLAERLATSLAERRAAAR